MVHGVGDAKGDIENGKCKLTALGLVIEIYKALFLEYACFLVL